MVASSSPSHAGSWGQHHGSDPDSQAGFQRAMDLVREEFLQRVDFYQHSWLPARALVQEALAQRFQVQARGRPWGSWLSDPGRLPASGAPTSSLTFQPCLPSRWTQVERSWNWQKVDAPGRSTSTTWNLGSLPR